MMLYRTFHIQAVALEHDIPEALVPCGTCIACCTGLSPILTPEEFISGKYVYTLLNTDNPGIPAIGIPRDKNGCYYLKQGKCSIYEDRPTACKQFDCRKNHYPPLKGLVLDKFNIELP